MYYSMYQALKQAISPTEGAVNVEWFNNQYEAGRLAGAEAVLVEFDPLEAGRQVKAGGQPSIGIRLHVVRRLTAEGSGGADAGAVAISDSVIREHEALARQTAEAVEGLTLPFDGGLTRPVRLTAYEQVYKHNGWLVGLLTLRTKG